MIKTDTVANGWYSDVTVSGDFASLIRDTHIILNGEIIALPGENVLFLSLGKFNNILYLAGQGAITGKLQLWNSLTSSWTQPCSTFGINVCAFFQNLLYVVTAPNVYQILDLVTNVLGAPISLIMGSQGIRYIDVHGNVVTGDMTEGPHPYNIAAFTDLGVINSHDLAIGQSYVDGVTGVYTDRRSLEPGNDCAVVRAYSSGTAIAVAIVHQNPTSERAVFKWFDVSDISSFPLEPTSAVTPPIHVTPPIVPPIIPPVIPPKPVSPFYKRKVLQ